MATRPLSKKDLDVLRSHDTPTVCNAIELFQVRPRNVGYMDKRIQAWYPELPPAVGYATTATFRAGAPAAGDVYGSLEKQIACFDEVSDPPIIVFQDLDDPPAGAVFGEVMCTTYKLFGAAGLITSGAGRDLDQVRRIDFPVFCNGAVCSHGYSLTPTVQVPVSVGGITVFPGDLLHADGNGVTTIPAEIADEVGQVCERFVASEALLFERLKSQDPTLTQATEALVEHRNRIGQLSREVSRAAKSQ